MKKYLILILLVTNQFQSFAQQEIASCCAKCNGSPNCRSCTNCSRCEHCNKNGGTCGACSDEGRSNSPQPPIYRVPSARVPTKEEKEIFENKRNTVNSTNINPNYGYEDAPFLGKVRAEAKTSIATGRLYSFENVTNFLQWLPTDGYMYRLGINNNSLRTKDENYNIAIKATSVLRIKLEADNDIHITICDWEDEYTPVNILTIEISGIPDENAEDYEALLKVRKQFYDEFDFMKMKKSASYKTMSKAPKIALKGSLYFDHYHNRENENDEYNKMKHKSNTSFEIHPVIYIERID